MQELLAHYIENERARYWAEVKLSRGMNAKARFPYDVTIEAGQYFSDKASAQWCERYETAREAASVWLDAIAACEGQEDIAKLASALRAFVR